MTELSKKKRRCGKMAAVRFGSAMLCGGLMYIFQTAICADAAPETELVHDTETVQSGEIAQGTQENQEIAEITELSQIMVANVIAPMKSRPDDAAETLMTYEKDALVFVIGETANGWYFVTYQDKEGYVQKDLLSLQEIDIEGLNAEMAASEEEAKLVVEVVEKYRSEARRSKIWGSIIIVLVVSIFAVGIVSTVKPQKSKGSDVIKRKKRKQMEIEDWN